MFIAHGEKIRKHSRWIMAGVLLLLIPGFIALFTQTDTKTERENAEMPTVHGKPMRRDEYQEMVGLVQAQAVVLEGRQLKRTAAEMDHLKQQAVVEWLMARKAKELGIQVTDEELIAQVRAMAMLQNQNGQFEPEQYRRLLIYLNNLGINEPMFEQVIRSQLVRAKLQQLVTSAAKVTPLEVQQAYLPLHEKVTIDLVTFKMADYQGPVTVSNEEVRAYYEQAKESFAIPEKVKVRYAFFATAEAAKKVQLTDEEIADYFERNKNHYAGTNSLVVLLATVKDDVKKDLLNDRAERAAADRANEFAVKLAGQAGETKPDFLKTCADFGVTPQTTDFLTRLDPLTAIPGKSADFVTRAFGLSADAPDSDPVAGENGFFVLQYVDSQPETIPPFEDVQVQATAKVKEYRTFEATVRQGLQQAADLKKLVASGKTFAQACAELKLVATTPAPFTVADDKLTLPAAASIQQASLGMPVAAVSEFIRTKDGGLVFYLRDRQAADLTEFEADKDHLTRQLLQRNRQALFNDWLRSQVETEQVDFKIKPRQPQAEEEPS